MIYLRALSAVYMLVLLASCAHRPPVIKLYDIISPIVALCTDTKGEECDAETIDNMIGYTCISPMDEGRVKKFIRKSTETAPLSELLKSP